MAGAAADTSRATGLPPRVITTSSPVTDPEELLTIHDATAFEPEEGELEQLQSSTPARRRGRPRKRGKGE